MLVCVIFCVCVLVSCCKEEVSSNSVFFVAGVRSPRRSVKGSLWRVHCFSVCGQQEVMSAVTPLVSPGSVQVQHQNHVSRLVQFLSSGFCLFPLETRDFTSLHCVTSTSAHVLTQEAAGCYHEDRFHLSYTSSSSSFLFIIIIKLLTTLFKLLDYP